MASAPWFPIPTGAVGQRDSVAHVEVDGSTVNICVTDAAGVKREYQAQVVAVSDGGTRDDFSLLAPVPVPAGVTAGLWDTDAKGHLVRTLSDGRVQRGNGDIIVHCKHCTVPVDSGDTCNFCQTYVPPACTCDVWCGCTCHACTVTFEHCAEPRPLRAS